MEWIPEIERNVNWAEVKDYLKSYIDEFFEIADTKDVVYIGSDFPNEFTGSKYTYKLKGAVAKAKANAAQGIPEMLENIIGIILETSIREMRNSDGIGMIQGLHLLFMGGWNGIMCFMLL